MHEGRKPGLDAKRDRMRHEEPLRLDGDRQHGQSDSREPKPGALGGDVATRSGTAPTPASDRDDAKERSS